MLQTEVPIIGEKNMENVLASVLIARHFKIKPQIIRKAIAEFKAPNHRLEFLGELNGAKIFDDSKSTNVACTIMAVQSLGADNLILLVGGRNKDNNFDLLFSKNFKAKKVLCFGECNQELFDIAKKFSFDCEQFNKMSFAVQRAKEIVQSGDVILLSPACASFDEFSSYAARGEIFKELIFEK